MRARGALTLPAEIRAQLDLNEGDQVSFDVADDHLIVTPVHVAPKSQAWFWTPEWQVAEREADDDRAAGGARHFDSDGEFLASLDD